ncbi:MAG: VCBS repeat-containing protein [Paracoccaceae bacterium]
MLRACAVALALTAGQGAAEGVSTAEYDEPTTRYAHGVLGDAIEHGALVVETTKGRRLKFVLPQSRVFEDTEPRVVDVDNDGFAEVVVVESDARRGARLAIYGVDGLITANDYIGQSNRWLAPVGVGAADLDGDGLIELAFVDRPHLARTLKIYRYQGRQLTQVAAFPAVTNHRIGERDIAGGIRDCGKGPELIVANAFWTEVLALRFDGQTVSQTRLGPHDGRASFVKAMACK